MAQRGEYTAIHTALVDDEGFQALGADARLCFYTLKLILGPSGIEVVRMFVPQMAQLTGLSDGPLRFALDELTHKRWLRQQGDVVWLRNGLRFNPNMNLSNDNHRLGVERHLRGLPSSAIVNAFAQHYGYPEIATGKGCEWDAIPYTNQVHGTRDTVVGKGSEAKASGGAPTVDNPEFPTVKEWLAHWMPILRELNYECDQHDGSILKALYKKKLRPPDIEPAFRGLALMRDHGKLNRMGIGPEDKLSARVIYADQGDRPRPFWNECVEYWHQQQPKAKTGHGMKDILTVIDGIRRGA